MGDETRRPGRAIVLAAFIVTAAGQIVSPATPDPHGSPSFATSLPEAMRAMTLDAIAALDPATPPLIFPRAAAEATLGALIPAGDLDGDGVGDVINKSSPQQDPFITIEARRGSDGDVMWSRTFGGRLLGDLVLATVEGLHLDQGPTADVLAINYEQITTSALFMSTLTLTAVRGEDGATMSEVVVRGVRVEFGAQPRRVVAHGSPARPGVFGQFFLGLGPDADGDGGQDVLVAALSGTDAGDDGEWTLEWQLRSMATGGVISSALVEGHRAVPTAWIVPDHTGDGLADVVAVSPYADPDAGHFRHVSFDGLTGQQTALSDRIFTPAVSYRARGADLDGNGRADTVLAGWDGPIDPTAPLETWGLSDAGALLWRRAAKTPMIPSADIDGIAAPGGGPSEDIVQRVSATVDGLPSVRYTALRGEDLAVIWSTPLGPFAGKNLVVHFPESGDHDGDGINDPVTIFAASTDGGSTLKDAVVYALGGASGAVLWSRSLGPSIANTEVPVSMRTDVDGDGGMDLASVGLARSGATSTAMVVAVAGSTGATLWGPVPGPSLSQGGLPYAFASAQDTTGDQIAEILVSIGTQAAPVTYTGSVLEEGTLLWSL